jgi:hypothetical protein
MITARRPADLLGDRAGGTAVRRALEWEFCLAVGSGTPPDEMARTGRRRQRRERGAWRWHWRRRRRRGRPGCPDRPYSFWSDVGALAMIVLFAVVLVGWAGPAWRRDVAVAIEEPGITLGGGWESCTASSATFPGARWPGFACTCCRGRQPAVRRRPADPTRCSTCTSPTVGRCGPSPPARGSTLRASPRRCGSSRRRSQ